MEVRMTFWLSSVPTVAKYCSISQRKFSRSFALRLPENLFGSGTFVLSFTAIATSEDLPTARLSSFTSTALLMAVSVVSSPTERTSVTTSSNLGSHAAIMASRDSPLVTNEATNISKASICCDVVEDSVGSAGADIIAINCSK
ncbi:hypothetical protein Syun_011755 [Stephania yunnanensis]|uniref:Uncharacterized protein n=1 Tax=Stephania yunnanensis TaxID=152371 RepID=A0AAP0JZ60_9MAGN